MLWLKRCGLWYLVCLGILGLCLSQCERCLSSKRKGLEEEAMGDMTVSHFVSHVVSLERAVC